VQIVKLRLTNTHTHTQYDLSG